MGDNQTKVCDPGFLDDACHCSCVTVFDTPTRTATLSSSVTPATPAGTMTPAATQTATGIVLPEPGSPTATASATVTPTPPEALGDRPGDANCDADVSAADLTAAIELLSEGTRAGCMLDDADGDGNIDVEDIEQVIVAVFGVPCEVATGSPCPEGRFCPSPQGWCTPEGILGLCESMPTACSETFDPVCSCSGITYVNDCQRRSAGASKRKAGPCPADPTPTQTPADCGADAPSLDPVTSPTDALEQVVTGSVFAPGPHVRVEICGEAGCDSVQLPFTHPVFYDIALVVPLEAGVTNHLEACAYGMCAAVACTDLDRNGDPLEIIQTEPP